MFPEKYCNNRNIGPFKYRLRLSIHQINYSIDDIDYRTALTCPASHDGRSLSLSLSLSLSHVYGFLHKTRKGMSIYCSQETIERRRATTHSVSSNIAISKKIRRLSKLAQNVNFKFFGKMCFTPNFRPLCKTNTASLPVG
jgi:hypothetical protein